LEDSVELSPPSGGQNLAEFLGGDSDSDEFEVEHDSDFIKFDSKLLVTQSVCGLVDLIAQVRFKIWSTSPRGVSS
jgi:hypothetical protein